MPKRPPLHKMREIPPAPAGPAESPPCAYAELEVVSNFSFLRGASHADELIFRATELGYTAIAITDVNTLSGVVRAWDAIRKVREQGGTPPKLIVGARLVFSDGTPDLLAWPMDRAGYGRLCRLLTIGKRRAEKGECSLTLEDFLAHQEGMQVGLCSTGILPVPSRLCPETPGTCGWTSAACRKADSQSAQSPQESRLRVGSTGSPLSFRAGLSTELHGQDTRATNRNAISLLRDTLGDRLSLVASCLYGADDADHLRRMALLSQQWRIPLLAANAVHYHAPERRMLQDVLACIRHGCTIADAGFRLFPNGEHYLKSPDQMARLFADYPQAIARSLEVASRCDFDLGQLRYEYPHEITPPGMTAMEYLSKLAWTGMEERYPCSRDEETKRRREQLDGSTSSLCLFVSPSLTQHAKVREILHHELALIEQLHFEAYFLTVYDIVKFARSRGILCQGRGSAANSAVCYCLGITSVDPARIDVLFERFISAARNEPPDIDVDFEHERREEVLQYIYEKYGRDRAGMTAEVITYRGRSAVRDVGKALGLSLDLVDSLAKRLDWWHRGTLTDDQLREQGLDPSDRTIRMLVDLVAEILGFPRHLSQHVGGMVMTRGPLCELVPIENAAMPGRTVIEWDKDDIDALGMLKVDCLGLGMLSCISKCFRLVEAERRRDEETERRSGQGRPNGIEERVFLDEEDFDGERAHLSRVDCLAEGDVAGEGGLPGDCRDAIQRAVRPDSADASCGGFDSFQHRRGIRTPEPSRPGQISSHGQGLIERTVDPASACLRHGDDHTDSSNTRAIERNGSSSSRIDPKPGTEVELDQETEKRKDTETKRQRDEETKWQRTPPVSSPPPPTSSLRLSVAPSLSLQLHTVPPEDPLVYDMICRADTVGVFQIESRAQMSMLPRLRPRCFYDLVIEVAIVRPGPIQGNMVHPYLRRRNGEEPVTYPSEALRKVLEKTLGVPLFQEQAMRVAMVGAGFTADEADRLRRAMAAWRRHGAIDQFHQKIINGMLRNGYTREFAEQCFLQIRGFGEYGFPESHAASFALLVYVSAWLKCHHPAAFCAAILNSQPMGFYAPAQLVRDAREHGVEVRGVDVNASEWDCLLERRDGETERQRDEVVGPLHSLRLSVSPSLRLSPAVRLGFRLVKGLRESYADAIVAARRKHGPFTSVAELQRRADLPRHALVRLAQADAFASLGLSRRQALWQAMALDDERLPLFEGSAERDEETKRRRDGVAQVPAPCSDNTSSLRLSVSPSLGTQHFLPPMPPGEEVMHDYATTGLSLKKHPVSLVRAELEELNILTAEQLRQTPHGKWVSVAGLVLVRQRPGTASGIVFETLEDETGIVNLIVRPNIYEKFRPAARHAALLNAQGFVERQGEVVHVMAYRLFDLSPLLAGHSFTSRDFH